MERLAFQRLLFDKSWSQGAAYQGVRMHETPQTINGTLFAPTVLEKASDILERRFVALESLRQQLGAGAWAAA